MPNDFFSKEEEDAALAEAKEQVVIVQRTDEAARAALFPLYRAEPIHPYDEEIVEIDLSMPTEPLGPNDFGLPEDTEVYIDYEYPHPEYREDLKEQ